MRRQIWIVLTAIVFLSFSTLAQAATPLGPGFTYQGRYEQDGAPLTGTVNLRFSLWDAEEGGAQIGARQVVRDVPIQDGLFNTIINASEEFGPDAYNGQGRWLEIEACDNPTCDTPTLLTPRQPLTATPYGYYAATTPWDGLTGVPDGFADGVDNSGDSLWGEDGGNAFFNNGKVGVGTTTPHHQLRISGGPGWTTNQWTGSMELDNAAAIGWRGNSGGQRFGIGQSTGGLYFFRTASEPGSATNPAQYDMIITDNGSVGIGTTTPGTKFQVNDGRIRIRESATQERWDLFYDPPSEKFYFQENAAFNHLVFTKGPDSHVGMGTDSPAAKLHVVNSAGDAILGNAPNGNGVVGRNASPGNAATAGINSAQDGVGILGQAILGPPRLACGGPVKVAWAHLAAATST